MTINQISESGIKALCRARRVISSMKPGSQDLSLFVAYDDARGHEQGVTTKLDRHLRDEG